jgi:hypothetical protein
MPSGCSIRVNRSTEAHDSLCHRQLRTSTDYAEIGADAGPEIAVRVLDAEANYTEASESGYRTASHGGADNPTGHS